MKLLREKALDAAEDFGVHRGSEAAGLGVLLAGVIDAEKAGVARGEFGFCAVGERVGGARGDGAALLQDFEVSVPGDFSERQHGARLEDFQFAEEIVAAIREFGGERLIGGRSAADGGGDVGVFQLEAVVAANGSGLIGEARSVERGEEKIAGAVSSENAAGAVAAVGGGSEAENEELGMRVAETGDGLAPVGPIAKGSAFFLGDFFAVNDEARALAAGDDFFVQDTE